MFIKKRSVETLEHWEGSSSISQDNLNISSVRSNGIVSEFIGINMS